MSDLTDRLESDNTQAIAFPAKLLYKIQSLIAAPQLPQTFTK
ncbi:hypothetical protein [Roseofilum casamattae]|uniref:Uncharacterized protein n=1 Tax=Roseofilum casamattae BLCC-M143 TaxID=3022442 RepID=A0ABT7C2B4_9CYAN|nr:hypothetical protein [Roseofilum casamattae]MDJ1185566.1 hypothetical protein [Roseofilum casamattae BLCC-M143]